MKNKRLEIGIIIFCAELLLIGIAFLVSGDRAPWAKEQLKFLSVAEMTDFRQEDPNSVADSLLLQYLSDTSGVDTLLHRRNLSKIGPKKKNLYLFNPDVKGVTALDDFFNALQNEKDTSVIRIAHYGDSQLEGDRMSCLMREEFHEKFGGSGVGYVPLKDLAPVSYSRNSSGNWARYTVFHDKYSNNFYGLSGLVFHFSRSSVFQDGDDSTGYVAPSDTNAPAESGPYNSASVSVKLSPKLAYNQVSVLYGRSTEQSILNYYNNETGERLRSDTLPATKEVQLHKRVLDQPVLKLRLEFSSGNSPDFYGVYLDALNGVQVDNYAIRGHSGDGLLLIDDAHLARMIKLLNTKLIIFQYGANVVPCVRSDKACQSIEALYYRVFMKFKKAAPDISILVVSSGDMARGGTGGYSSYEWLPKIVQAQKNAALKANCAFFDLFHMMGGSNSILVWASRRLAVNNGHFSASGQEIIANELVDALMVEYNYYLHKQRKANK
jgi:lysophospholipase L1-like esterase